MNCKNCQTPLSSESKFCPTCGGKVITERITFKYLMKDVASNVFGWDNKYFRTLRAVITRPQVILKEYINGTRKKYMNPFSFFAIGAALALLVFNQFADEYVELSNSLNEGQIELMEKAMHDNITETQKEKHLKAGEAVPDEAALAEEFKQEQLDRNAEVQKSILKYFNLFAFVILPIYTFIAFLVFGKPYNYGEHLVINAFIQGVTFLMTVLFFLGSLFVSPHLYFLSMLVMVIFYTYVYAKLYDLTFGKSMVKVLKFIGVLLGVILAFAVVLFIIGVIFGLAKKMMG